MHTIACITAIIEDDKLGLSWCDNRHHLAEGCQSLQHRLPNYCYVYHAVDQGWRRQPRRMSEQTIDAVISRVSETESYQCKPLTVLLHGGEPLLLGKTRLRKLLLGLRSGLGDESTIALQTNGILLDHEVVELLAESRTTVGGQHRRTRKRQR